MKQIVPREIMIRGRQWFRVIVPKDVTGEKRQRLFFLNPADADAKCKELSAKRHDVAAGFYRLAPKEQVRLLLVLDNVQGDVHAIESAVAEYLKSPRCGPARPVADVIAECLAEKEAAGLRKRSLQQLKCSLGNFSAGIGSMNVAAVTPEIVQKWLHGQNFAPGTKRAYLIDCKTFFSFAEKRGYCAKNPAAAVEPIRLDQKKPGIHTAEQAKTLLDACMTNDPGLIGYLAPLYFAGLRPAECEQLTPQMIHFDERFIHVPAEIAKNGERFIAMLDPVLAWLCTPGKRIGPGFINAEFGPRNLKRRLLKVRAACPGLPWPHDVLRHTFCSNAMVVIGATKAADMAGHSEAIQRKHYRQAVKPADAAAFWALRPTVEPTP